MTATIAPPINPKTPPMMTMKTSPKRPAPIPSPWEPRTDPIPPRPAARKIPTKKPHTSPKTAKNFPTLITPNCLMVYVVPDIGNHTTVKQEKDSEKKALGSHESLRLTCPLHIPKYDLSLIHISEPT